jgi:hypothetical protein
MWPFPKKHSPPDLKARHQEALHKLVGMGYLKFVPSQDHERIKEQILFSMEHGTIDSQWDARGVAHDRRSYPVDMEALAHGGIGGTLTLMKNVLVAEGCRLDSVVDDYRKSEEGIHYDLLVNGERLSVGEMDDDNLRRIALQRLLSTANWLLRQAQSQETLVGTQRAGALRAMFLTREMLEYLIALPGIEFRWFTSYDLFAC